MRLRIWSPDDNRSWGSVSLLSPCNGHARSHRLLSQNGHAPHEAPLVRTEIRAGVQRAAVVPDQKIAGSPDMLIDELGLLLVIEQQVEKLLAVLARHPLDPHRHQAIHIEGLA